MILKNFKLSLSIENFISSQSKKQVSGVIFSRERLKDAHSSVFLSNAVVE